MVFYTIKRRWLAAQLAGLLISFAALSQAPRVIPPSPEAAALGKFGDIPVSNYTGTPSISVPLYALQAGKFSLPISLNYHAGGIKVEEEASWVGLGWALQAGGQITRTVKGLNDLGLGGYPFADEPDPDDEDYLHSVARGTNDSEPDIFYFSFAGRSGKFMLEQTTGGVYKPRLFSKEKLDISYSPTTHAWTIISEDGTRYLFEVEELTVPASGEGTSYSGAVLDLASSTSFVSTWHLSQIVLITGERINFEYNDSAPVQYRSLPSVSQRFRAAYNTTGNPVCVPLPGTSVDYLASRNTHQGIYLQRIRYNDIRIDFISEDRQDLEPVSTQLPQRLKEVRIIETLGGSGNTLKTFELSYSYFNNSLSGYTQKRLKLTGVQEKSGATSVPPYTFEYHTSPSYTFELPAKNSASRDLWGFFNGKNNGNVYSTYFSQNITECLVPPISVNAGGITTIEDTGADRGTDAQATKLGVLTRIVYPTGGTTEFEHEAHDYYSPWTETVGVPQLVQLFRYGPLVANPPTGAPTETMVDLSGASGNTPISIYAAIYCYNYQELGTSCSNRAGFYGDIYEVLPNNTEVHYAALPINAVPDYTITESTQFNFNLPSGKYIVRTYNPNDAWVTQLEVEYISPTGTVNHNNRIAGGLRVSKITSKPSTSETAKVTAYKYESAPGSSSGLLMNPHVQFYHYEVATATCGVNEQGTVHYLTRRSWNNFPLGTGAQGSHVGYSMVSVLEGESGENGKSVYEYINYPEDINLDIILPDETTVAPNQNGLLLSQTDYRRDPGNTFVRIRSIVSQYDENTSLAATTPGIKVYPVSLSGTNWAGAFKPYYLYSDRWELRKQTETLYESDTKYTGKVTDYFYENPNHLQLTKQRESQSDGTTLETVYKYPLDYTGVSGKASFIQKLIDAHHVSYPLETVTVSEASPSARKTVNASVTTYKVFTGPTSYPELLLPYKVFAFHLLDGSGTFTAYPGTSDETASASYRETLRYTHYDTQANPLSLLVKGGDKISYLWSYKGLYPVAQILNADYGEVASALSGAGSSHGALSALASSSAISTVTGSIGTSLTAAQVTSYTYKPLNGIETLTDPAGKTFFYEYDALGRLKNIRNNNSSGAVRASYCYNYAGQAVDCATISTTGTVTPPTLMLLADDNSPPLPVTLVDFKAVKEGETAQLLWTTTSETDSDHFQIERSTDAIAWTSLGTIAAKGDHTGNLRYSFTDPSPAAGENFYRLKMVDIDGSFSHSRIESLHFGGNDIIAYPNPITVETTLHLKTVQPGRIQKVTLYDMAGKMVYDGAYRERLDVSGLVPGLYLINVIDNDGTVSVYRIVKK